MKRLIIIVFVLVSTSLFSQGFKQKMRMMRFTHDLAPIVSYTNRLQVANGADTLTVHSLGIGFTFTNGDVDMSHFPLSFNWQYSSLPYVKLDFNFANRKDKKELFNPQDGAFPIILSAGITAGKGFGLLILPIGINGTAGLATDFRDGFLQYGLAYDAVGFSIGITGLYNVTKSNNSYYKSEIGLEFRYIWGWD